MSTFIKTNTDDQLKLTKPKLGLQLKPNFRWRFWSISTQTLSKVLYALMIDVLILNGYKFFKESILWSGNYYSRVKYFLVTLCFSFFINYSTRTLVSEVASNIHILEVPHVLLVIVLPLRDRVRWTRTVTWTKQFQQNLDWDWTEYYETK